MKKYRQLRTGERIKVGDENTARSNLWDRNTNKRRPVKAILQCEDNEEGWLPVDNWRVGSKYEGSEGWTVVRRAVTI